MKKLAMMVAAIGLAAASAAAADVSYFHKTYAAAVKQARKENKPLYLHFTTTWCGWCRRIEDDIYRKEDGKKALSAFVCASLDCTVPRGQQPTGTAKFNIDMMRKYGGGGYPFLLMVTPEGNLLHTMTGYRPIPAFVKELDKARQNLKKLRAFQAYAAKADKTGYEYNARALEFYSATGMWAKAAEAAAVLKKLDPQFKKGRAAPASYALVQGAITAKADEAKIRALEDDVAKHDPKNAEGFLEKVLWGRAARNLRRARTQNEAARKQAFADAAQALETLLKQAAKLSDKPNIYGYLGFIRMQAGQLDQAQASMEKALSLEPKTSRRAAMFQRYVDMIKKLKAQKSGAAGG
jgi:thioredoxin-related protein